MHKTFRSFRFFLRMIVVLFIAPLKVPGFFFMWICFLSPFRHDFSSTTNFFHRASFLTDGKCIKKCYNSEQNEPHSLINFLSQQCKSVYVDNCTNCHILNNKEHFVSFTPYQDSDISRFVHTIGGGTQPLGEGTV